MSLPRLTKTVLAAAMSTALLGTAAIAQSIAPITINSQRQLFVDDFVIEEAFAVERTVIPPAKHAGNPIMRPEKPWEGGYIDPAMMLYDAESRSFRMWYRAWSSIKPPVERYMCYATSSDGIHWERPNLGLARFRGSMDNNLIQSLPDMHIVYDPHDPDPSRRYKGAGRFDTEGLCVAFSADGFQWTNYDGKNPVIKKAGDSNTLLGWDELHKKYVGYFRPFIVPERGESIGSAIRKIGRSTSDDFIHWSPLETVLEPDNNDTVGTQFYEMYVTRYEGVYFGLLLVLHIDRAGLDYMQTDAKGLEHTMDAQLAFSRDGIRWTRLGNRQAWLPLGPAQSWDDQLAYPSQVLTVGGEIWVYYVGGNIRHTVEDLRLSGQRVNGRWYGAPIGLAKLRQDGWVVARPEAGADEAWIVTRPVKFDGKSLWVNADARDGSLAVEILDEQRNPIPGYERANCQPIASDATSIAVQWRGVDLSQLEGRTVRLKFYLNRARLYSFWCQGDAHSP